MKSHDSPPSGLDTPMPGRVLSARDRRRGHARMRQLFRVAHRTAQHQLAVAVARQLCRSSIGGDEAGTGIAALVAAPVTYSMARDLRIARRAEHRVALWTICLLSACLVLEVGTLASTFSHRAELRAAASAPPLPGDVGSKRSRFTTRQAVGYWFIPLVNLVRAYQVMKDLWLRSESMNDRDAYDDLPAPPLLSGWGGMSLAWGVLEPVVAATAGGARTPLDPTNVTDVALIGSVVGIVAAVLAISVVRGIDQRQQCFSSSPPDLPAPSRTARRHGAPSQPPVNTPDR